MGCIGFKTALSTRERTEFPKIIVRVDNIVPHKKVCSYRGASGPVVSAVAWQQSVCVVVRVTSS